MSAWYMKWCYHGIGGWAWLVLVITVECMLICCLKSVSVCLPNASLSCVWLSVGLSVLQPPGAIQHIWYLLQLLNTHNNKTDRLLANEEGSSFLNSATKFSGSQDHDLWSWDAGVKQQKPIYSWQGFPAQHCWQLDSLKPTGQDSSGYFIDIHRGFQYIDRSLYVWRFGVLETVSAM